jgi:phosphonate metabolism protein PhnN/1,5-bisphosphokinase (PRPP-forming)
MHPRRGMLVLVVGPSGAGKDSLLRCAARSLADEPRIGFPRRVVTRPCRSDVEAHDTMTPQEFADATKAGRFALRWQAHGLGYGISVSVIDDLERGRTLAVNVSRRVLAEACRRFSPVTIFNVTAPPHLLLHRLGVRGREAPGDVEARIAREAPDFPEGVAVVTIVNDSTIELAEARFSAALLQLLPSAETFV